MDQKKLITITLAIVICIAAIVVLYVNLPQDQNTNDDNTNEEPVVLLTVTYGDEQSEYTLEELEDFSSTTGFGRYIKSKALKQGTVIIEPDLNGPAWEFTGVEISTLVDQFENLPDNYNITVTASDDWTSGYTKDNVTGAIDIYNETGAITATSGATMILAYKEDGSYYSEIDPDNEVGPLRIAFVGEDVITLSSLWSKMVVSIEVVEL